MFPNVFYGWWIVGACFFISLLVSSIIFFGFTAFFEPLQREFGWSYTQISLAASLRGLEMGIFSPLLGFLVDRFGSRKLVIAGVIAMGIGLIILSLTRSLAMFYTSFVLMAFGAGGCTVVVTMTAVANWFKKDVGKAIGVMSCGYGASGLLVPVIVWLIDVAQWRTALVIMGAGMWVVGLPLAWVIRDKPEDYGWFPDGKGSLVAAVQDDAVVPDREVSFREVLKHRGFLYLNLAESVRMMAVAAAVTHVMPYLSHLGVARTTAGLVAGAIPLFSIIGRFGLGWLADVRERKTVMMGAYTLMTAGMLAFSCVQIPWMIIVFLLLFSPGFGGAMVVRGAILRHFFGRKAFGKMMGVVMGTASLGGIVGPTLAGWGFDTTGSYDLVWYTLTVCLVLATVLMARFRP